MGITSAISSITAAAIITFGSFNSKIIETKILESNKKIEEIKKVKEVDYVTIFEFLEEINLEFLRVFLPEIEKQLFIKSTTIEANNFVLFLDKLNKYLKTRLELLKEVEKKFKKQKELIVKIKKLEEYSKIEKEKVVEILNKAKILIEVKNIVDNLKKEYSFIQSFWIPNIYQENNNVILYTSLDFENLSDNEFLELENIEKDINSKFCNKFISSFVIS